MNLNFDFIANPQLYNTTTVVIAYGAAIGSGYLVYRFKPNLWISLAVGVGSLLVVSMFVKPT